MINLVMEHSQRGNVFALWAKYELLGQDEKLVEQYNIRKYVLVEGDVRHDRERAFKLAAALAVGVLLLTFSVTKRPMLAILLALIAFVLGWIGIYYNIRETVTVADILDGRHFKCRSIVTLLEKRQQVTKMAQEFTLFLEALKNWGGREVLEITPDRPPVARFVEKTHAPSAAE